jgi:hypothetical protein
MKRLFVLAPIAVLFLAASASAAIVQKPVSQGSVGIGENGASIVAQKGAVVYARKGSNVQYWPGSKLVHVSKAGSLSMPQCGNATVTASGKEELMVGDGASACTTGDAAVIAFEGATVIYEDDVDLIRRPVRRK